MIRPKSRAPRRQEPPGKRLDGSWEWLEVSPSPRHWCARLLRSLPPIFAAEQKFGPGVTDIEIKIGQTMPYSGPASAYSTVGGRKINLISLDDAYSPPKTVEQIRRPVEVLMIFPVARNGTECCDSEISEPEKIPHLFVSSGASRFNDPTNFSYTTRWSPNYASKARVYLTVSIS
jgi:branched-chain amino acid transport system substrate-binding protein